MGRLLGYTACLHRIVALVCMARPPVPAALTMACMAIRLVGGYAVFGEATATNGNPVGVFGKVYTDGGTGVWGMASGTTNLDGIGVFGNTYALDGRGVKGHCKPK